MQIDLNVEEDVEDVILSKAPNVPPRFPACLRSYKISVVVIEVIDGDKSESTSRQQELDDANHGLADMYEYIPVNINRLLKRGPGGLLVAKIHGSHHKNLDNRTGKKALYGDDMYSTLRSKAHCFCLLSHIFGISGRLIPRVERLTKSAPRKCGRAFDDARIDFDQLKRGAGVED
jgi:hypothetical protein